MATAVRSDYQLDEEQLRFFDENGYLILRDRIPPELLARLQAAAARMIERGRAAAPDDPLAEDCRFADRESGRVMYRVDYLHSKGEPSTLELLGSPAVLGIAESLAGANFVPTYESVVFKDAGDGAAINWHQDAIHPRTHRIFNVDIYLDESRAGEGALRVAPGSQKQRVDICDLEGRYGWNAPGVIQVEMQPGDVLVHDVMLVHGSEGVVGNRLRRTIYYEFRPAEQILAEGPWDRDWVDQRLRLIPLGLAEYAERNPAAEQFAWQPSDDLRPTSISDRETELRVVHTVHSPGAYCSAGSVS
jgi:ectoine hydroxylase-related dioxygenase (phytanoyl-CoA dioxygenase family)